MIYSPRATHEENKSHNPSLQADNPYLSYGKASLRQIPVLWLVLSRSGFCSADRFQPMYFCFGTKAANLNLQAKQRKKLWTLSFFRAKLPEKAKKIEILSEISKMNEEDEHSPKLVLLSWRSGNFWCRNWNRHHFKTILSTNRKVQTQRQEENVCESVCIFVALYLCDFVCSDGCRKSQ